MANLSWADVANDLLILIAEKVAGVVSFIRFSAVCKSWHMVASATKCCRPVPWLMLAEREDSEVRDFYDHSTGEVYQFPVPEAWGKKIVGSAHGWLITGDVDGDLCLLNPLTGTQIDLPPISAFESVDFESWELTPEEVRNFFTIKATCSPIEPDSDCTVALTHRDRADCLLSFCQPPDTEWSGFVDLLGPIEVSYMGGFFYIVSKQEVYRCAFSSTEELTKIVDLPQYFSVDFWILYIVDCAGEILVVGKRWSDDIDLYAVEFKVLKLDLKAKKAIEVKSIGDNALFLGTNNSICLPTTSGYQHIFRRNCIYFTDDRQFIDIDVDGELGDDVGVFDLADESFSRHFPGGSLSYYSFSIWVTVNPLDLPKIRV